MHNYQGFAAMLKPIEEKDLILFEMNAEEKIHAVKQYNRALLNAQKDGADVSQIILKSLIEKYPYWGDCALVYALCLARDKKFKRAEEALTYAVNNTLGSEQNLSVAQEAMRCVRDDMKNPELKPDIHLSSKSWTQIASEENNAAGSMRAPILVKASSRMDNFQMASEKERRDIMMRSASVGDEVNSDDLRVEDVTTPADRLRRTVKVVTVILVLTVLFLLIYFGLIPLVRGFMNSKDNENRLNFLIEQLDQNKQDPEVGNIIAAYASEFGGETTVSESETTTTTVEETTTTTTEATTVLAPIVNDPEATSGDESEESTQTEEGGESETSEEATAE